jgi:hypothetical protein
MQWHLWVASVLTLVGIDFGGRLERGGVGVGGR